MGVVKYIGPAPTIEVALPEGGTLNATRSQSYELSNTIIQGLLNSQPKWWEVVEGYEPPPAPPPAGTVTVTSAYTLQKGIHMVYADATSGEFAITPIAANQCGGEEWTIRAIATNGNVVSIMGIEGTTLKLSPNERYVSVTIASDGKTLRVV